MSYTFDQCDSFDHYTPGGPYPKFLLPHGAVGVTAGPIHGQAARCTGGGSFVEGLAGGSVTNAGRMAHVRLSAPAGWGPGVAAVAPMQLLLFDVVKQTLLVHADGRLTVHLGEADGAELAASAPGTFGFGAWHHVCYSSALWESGPDVVGAGGRVDVFVDGLRVAGAEGVATCEPPHRQSHGRLGNCLDDGNTAVVDLDDYAGFYSFETDFPMPDAPLFSGPHAVKCLYPVGPGDLTEMGLVGAAPANWAAHAEPIGDGDATCTTKSAGSDQHDLYRFDPTDPVLAAYPDDEEDPALHHWGSHAFGLVRDAGGVFRYATLLLRFEGPAGERVEFGYRRACLPDAAYGYTGNRPSNRGHAARTLQAGWGQPPSDPDPDGLADAFRASQTVFEVWYPAPPPPAPAGGGPRWSVGWLG